MTWQLRRATAADLDAIMTIESNVFGSDAWSAELMRGELANPHSYYLVAFPPGVPDRVDGYAGLRAPLGAGDGDVQTIAVACAARRKGLGRTLLLSLVNEAGRRGVSELFLEVRADNAGAQALYELLGFEQIAVRAGYYQPDNIDAHVMRLRLSAPHTKSAVSA
jgi:ribosomal-protein-alanine N-acetyltransferase